MKGKNTPDEKSSLKEIIAFLKLTLMTKDLVSTFTQAYYLFVFNSKSRFEGG